MKVNYEMAIEENKELESKVDEQQHNTKHFIKQYDNEDEDRLKEISATSTWSSSTIIAAKFSEIERWLKVTWMTEELETEAV